MKARFLGLPLPPALWLLLFLIVPAGVVCSAGLSADGWKTLQDPVTHTLFLRSLRIAALVTLGCLVAGYPMASFIAGCTPKWRNILLFLVILPFWTNLLVRTFALMFLLRPLGILHTELAVVIGIIHSYIPFMVLPIYVTLEKLPPRVLEASRDLGATPWQTFWRVTVPMTAPGIAAGCLLVFVPVLGSFALPALLGGASSPMIGNQIELFFKRPHGAAAGSALTLLLTGFTMMALVLYYRFRKTEGLV